MLSGTAKNGSKIVEFNVYKYSSVPVEGERGILISAYSKRAYDDMRTTFLKDIRRDRSMHISQINALKVPELNLTQEEWFDYRFL